MDILDLPDYSNYSINDIVDVYKKIDKLNYPDRLKSIEEHLRKRFNLAEEQRINETLVDQLYHDYLLNNPPEKKGLKKYYKQIKYCWIAALILTFINVIIVMLAFINPNQKIETIKFVDALINNIFYLGFTYGVYKKSRISAVLLFVLFFIHKMVDIVQLHNTPGIIGLFIFGYFFVMGIIGTINYHKENQIVLEGIQEPPNMQLKTDLDKDVVS